MAVGTDQVTVTNSTSKVEIKSFVQVGPTTKYATTISFEVFSNSDNVKIEVKQATDQYPAA